MSANLAATFTPRLRQMLVAAMLATSAVSTVQAAEVVQVFKTATCGCCGKWVDHMRAAGFDVRVNEVLDVGAERKRLGMPDALTSCHTAVTKAGGTQYVLEGQVPAGDVKRLLKQKPKALGIAVPGMPSDAPGMDGKRGIPYDTLLVKADGTTTVFAKH